MLVDLPNRPGDSYTFRVLPQVGKLVFEPLRISKIV
jgi:hypothetical protein